MNWSKFEIYFWKAISETRINKIRQFADMKRGTLPFSYLGDPLFVGAPKRKWLQPLADKICNKFSKWKGKSLSMASRLTLI